MQQEQPEQCPLGPPKRNRAAVVEDLERAKDAEIDAGASADQ
jgi:hypothetical protein